MDIGVEDHHTSAPLSVRKTDEALSLLDDLLVIELLLARDVLALSPKHPALGTGTTGALQIVEAAIAAAQPRPEEVHRAVRARLAERAAVARVRGPRL